MRQPPRLVPALFLILLGGWLLARELGLPLPGAGQAWPVALILVGLGLVGQHLFGGRQQPGLVFTGTLLAALGAFFLSITLGPLDWGDLSRYWPVFVLIGGLGYLAQWLAQPADRALLRPAGLALAAGAIALVFTLELAGPGVAAQARRFWPLLLVAAGLLLLWRYLRQARGS
jgi:hypothetical protein